MQSQKITYILSDKILYPSFKNQKVGVEAYSIWIKQLSLYTKLFGTMKAEMQITSLQRNFWLEKVIRNGKYKQT